MREIGRIKQVQIQRSSLKAGQKPYEYYDPSPLLVVRQLLLTAGGVIGITDEGEQVIDVHHADHERSRYRGSNGISLGFTSHYRAMRAQFGAHLWDGRAGENILVEVEQEQQLSDLESGIAIQSEATGDFAYMKDIEVATPCVPFSHFAAKEQEPLTNTQIKETLQFLNDGCRGFYATLANAKPVAIQAGDRVFVLDQETGRNR